jgi:hypothetical protein
MAGFDQAWLAVSGPRNGDSVSNRLRPLLEAVYQQVLGDPINLAILKQSLVELLTFLGAEGRTNANCWATDLFFAGCENRESDWTERNLPDSFHDILAMMSEALHDTVQAPGIAPKLRLSSRPNRKCRFWRAKPHKAIAFAGRTGCAIAQQVRANHQSGATRNKDSHVFFKWIATSIR